MGFGMLIITSIVAIFKKENSTSMSSSSSHSTEGLIARIGKKNKGMEDELDAAEIGIKETYHRLWAVCQLPSVRWLALILLTYRLPTSLSDNVKFLKAVEYGLSKSTTALLSPTLILPIGIIVPIIGAQVWHGHPLRQFMSAYKVRITLVPVLDVLMLLAVKNSRGFSRGLFWIAVVASTGMQAIVHSLQFNAQMTFFASRVDPAIGGSYMTCLNTLGNLGGTWPSSFVMYLVGLLTIPPDCIENVDGTEVCVGGRDAYIPLQAVFCVLGGIWVFLLGSQVRTLAELPDDAWRTHLLDSVEDDIESDDSTQFWLQKGPSKKE
jgi:PAT family acetyl-CoA transporter-like MFS transporter 1